VLAPDGTLRDSESAILMTFMPNEERRQRESRLIATVRKKLSDFARMCADDAEYSQQQNGLTVFPLPQLSLPFFSDCDRYSPTGR